MQPVDLSILGLGGQSVFLTVDHFHRNGETLHAGSLFHEPGGKGYNQAVAAARLGARVAFLGSVGRDADGDECEQRLIREGISPAIMVRKDVPTAYAAILTDRTGENRVTVFPGAAALLCAQDVREQFESVIASSRMLLMQQEIPQSAFEEALDIAQSHGIPVVLNPAPYAAWAVPHARRTSLITPNLSEAQQLLGLPADENQSPAALAEALRSAGFDRAVVTLGGKGALVVDGEQETLIPACRVQAVDTTGAGDCYNAALCVRLLEGAPLTAAAQFAARAAALSVSRAHVLDAMPLRTEADAAFR